MKLLRATVVIVVLLASARPISGQAPTTAPMFSRSALQRVAAASAPEFLPVPAPGQAPGDWSDIRRLATGTTVMVTSVDAASGPYEVLVSDDASLTVLNTVGIAASRRRSEIRRWATSDPLALARVLQGATLISGDLRIAPDGVFTDGRKILDLRQLLVRIPRADVRAISRAKGRTGSRVAASAAGGFLGLLGGSILGGIVGGAIGQAAGADPSNLGPMFLGLLAGGVTGAYFGQRAAAGPPAGAVLVYQAPASTP